MEGCRKETKEEIEGGGAEKEEVMIAEGTG